MGNNNHSFSEDSTNPDFAAIVRLHPESILVIDERDEVLFANTAAARLLCRLPDSGGRIPADWCIQPNRDLTTTIVDVNGREIVLSILAQAIDWRETPARLVTLCDITALEHQQRALEKLVYLDHLTGLYNRRGLELVAEHHHSAAKRDGHAIAAFYIDVNGLKQINDSRGHSTGDAAIRETADVLRHTFRDVDVKARIGGDEFVVLVAEDSQDTTDKLLDRLRQELTTRNETNDRRFQLAVSIGVGRYEAGGEFNMHQLLEEADRRMYVAKRIDNTEYARVQHGDIEPLACQLRDALTERSPIGLGDTLLMPNLLL